MQKSYEKFSKELREKILEALASSALQETVAATRAASAEDTGSFEVVISTEDVDRSGEVIALAGWDLSHYMNNPVVLWGHDYKSLPIGVCEEIGVRDVNGKQALVAKGRFAPEAANPFAQQVRRLYDAGMARTTSVGLIVEEMQGNTITKSQLLEFSFVPVPANPFALTMRQLADMHLDKDMLLAKGIAAVIKAEGDTCPLEDGTEGVIDAEGNCVPKPTTEESKDTPAEPAPAAPETPETPAPEAETPEEQKGAVSDEIDAEAAWEQKWANLDPVFDILDAFLNVYLDDATPVENFQQLLAETLDLLKPMTGAAAAPQGGETVAASVGKAKRKSVEKDIVRLLHLTLGDTDSEAGRAAIEKGIKALKGRVGALEAILPRSEAEITADAPSPKERSTHDAPSAFDALKAYSGERAALREVATIVSEALGRAAKRGPRK